MKVKLFTHTDLDGAMCPALARLLFNNEALIDTTYCSYNTIDEEILAWIDADSVNYDKSDYVFITDICCHEEAAAELNSVAKRNGFNLRLIDHHQTPYVLNVCSKYDWATTMPEYVDGTKACGASLFYDYILVNEYAMPLSTRASKPVYIKAIDKMVELVRLWDTFEWEKLPEDDPMRNKAIELSFLQGNYESLEVYTNALYHYTETMALYENNALIFSYPDAKYIEGQWSKLNNKVKYYKKYIAVSINGLKAGVIFDEEYALMSLACNIVLKDLPDVDFFIVLNLKYNKIEFRTVKDNINLGKDVAPKFGGGGHPKAAGATITDTVKGKIALFTLVNTDNDFQTDSINFM